MALQMYIVTLKGGYSDESSRAVQRFIRQCGGFILMVTRNGPLVMLDDSKVGPVDKHPLVEFIGGITLNPRGYAADRLKRVFAENLSKQIVVETEGDAESKS
jgi:hypothetical protein